MSAYFDAPECDCPDEWDEHGDYCPEYIYFRDLAQKESK